MRVVLQFQKKLYLVSVIGTHDEIVVAWDNYFTDAEDEEAAMSCAVDRFWKAYDNVLDPDTMTDSVSVQVKLIAETDGRYSDVVEAGYETNVNAFAQNVEQIVRTCAEESEEDGEDEATV